MDIATICVKELRKNGGLKDLDVSDENNACSINVDVDVGGQNIKYLLMFKNETHNHPTEIEPFGGAATCLGGAIRDPLSGRTYVYQAMRVSGSGDPTTPIENTIPNKLPQRIITTGAAKGYSSYGNQIGLATGHVDEIYHPGYVAKRMEIGAVIGAAPKINVIRKEPQAGDLIILLGGRTGRDGIGGATGSSKSHTTKSITESGAEVQKGNPICERKIQRLFRNPHATRLIKKCNDFGAGGVSVAIGELCTGIDINLDLIPKKYVGLNGTELAISESQERMAIVINKTDKERFMKIANAENLEATVVAKVTNNNRLCMFWQNKKIVDLSRVFLNTNGVLQHTNAKVSVPISFNQLNVKAKNLAVR
jgi:phosphoribosylformylglycinamidine synthase